MAATYTGEVFIKCENEAALLTAIRSNPLESLPRLTLADWLEEQGRGAEASNWRKHTAWPIRNAGFERLQADLATANGRRRRRTLALADCVYAALVAVRAESGWDAIGGSSVANAYGYPAERTVCVAARRDDGSVRIGVARASAQRGSSLTTPVTGLRVNAPVEQFRSWANQG